MRLLLLLVLLLPACARPCVGRVSPAVRKGGARATYVGKWDTKPSWSFWEATLDLKAGGTFEVVAFGAGADLRGTWRPVTTGVELRVLSEHGVSFAEDGIRPPRLTLRQETDDLLDARSVPTGGARYFERRVPLVEVAVAPLRDITALRAIEDTLSKANLTYQMHEADGHSRHFEVRTPDADQARRLLLGETKSSRWVVQAPADAPGPGDSNDESP